MQTRRAFALLSVSTLASMLAALQALIHCSPPVKEKETLGRFSAAITTSGPKIFLNGTYGSGTVLSYLKTRAAADGGTGDAGWVALKSDCDNFVTAIDTPGNLKVPSSGAYSDYGVSPWIVAPGYGGEDYVAAVMSLALCYQATSNPTDQATYGAHGATLLATMATTDTTDAGYGNNNHCWEDSCYGLRFYVPYLSIGLDWLAPAISTAQENTIVNGITYWLGGTLAGAGSPGGLEQQFPGVYDLAPLNNYMMALLLGETLAAIVLQDVDAGAGSLWSDVQNNLWPLYSTAFSSSTAGQSAVGGGWPEGWEYGPLSIREFSEFLWAARTGMGKSWDTQLPCNVRWAQSKYQQYFTWPSLAHIDDQGTVRSSNPVRPLTPSAELNGELAMQLEYNGDSTHAAIARQWTADVAAVQEDRAKASGSTGGPWEKFLYADSSLSLSPYNTQGLSWQATGPGHVAVRTDWSKTAAWATLVGGDYITSTNVAHQLFNQGAFALASGDQPIFTNASGWLPQIDTNGENVVYDDAFTDPHPRKLYNTFMTSSADPGQNGQTASQGATTHIERYLDTGSLSGGSLVRARATKIDGQYTQGPQVDGGGAAPVQQFMRDLVSIRGVTPATFILYDRTTVANQADNQNLYFYTSAAPTRHSTATCNGGYAYDVGTLGSLCTVLPASAVVTPSTSGLDGTALGNLSIAPQATGTAQWDWLNVASVGSTPPTISSVSVTSGAMKGITYPAQSGVSTVNQVVLFASDHAGAAYSNGVTYTLPSTVAANSRHYLIDMAGGVLPAVAYSISAVTSLGVTTVTVTQTSNGACAVGNNGIVIFINISSGTVGTCSAFSPQSGQCTGL